MARIVTVHGIGKQVEGEFTLGWSDALRSGVALAGGPALYADDIKPAALPVADRSGRPGAVTGLGVSQQRHLGESRGRIHAIAQARSPPTRARST